MALIRIEELPPGEYATLRGFVDPRAADKAAYDVISTLRWEPPNSCWMSGMLTKVKIDRVMLRAILAKLHYGYGIRYIRAERAEDHVLPRAERMPDGSWRLDILPYVDRRGNMDIDTGLTPLIGD